MPPKKTKQSQQTLAEIFAKKSNAPKTKSTGEAPESKLHLFIDLSMQQVDNEIGINSTILFNIDIHFLDPSLQQVDSEYVADFENAEPSAELNESTPMDIVDEDTAENGAAALIVSNFNGIKIKMKLQSVIDKYKIPVCIVKFRLNSENRMRCDICFRTETIEEHMKTEYHIECERAHRIATFKAGERPDTSLEISVSKAKVQMVNYVGKLLIQVFLDAKRLNLSAYSWPARYVASTASSVYNSQNQSTETIAENIPLQYVNPPGHLELMTTIVKSYHNDFMKKINECWAISLRIDGSVDLTQVDKIYVMAKIINLDGSLELLFMGIGQQKQRKAIGLKNASMEPIGATIGTEDPKLILSKVSSVCADGANVNTGDRSSLWTLLDKEMKAIDSKIPLIKIWCAAHRAELVWKATSEEVGEISTLFSKLSSISSYFRQSGLRTAELEQIGKDNHLIVHKLPKIFEIRWSQFSFTLLRSILVSWKALVIYFEKYPKDAVCAGYLCYLKRFENLKLIAFLGDVLFSFQRFQKKLQSDRLTIISMKS